MGHACLFLGGLHGSRGCALHCSVQAFSLARTPSCTLTRTLSWTLTYHSPPHPLQTTLGFPPWGCPPPFSPPGGLPALTITLSKACQGAPRPRAVPRATKHSQVPRPPRVLGSPGPVCSPEIPWATNETLPGDQRPPSTLPPTMARRCLVLEHTLSTA